MYKYINRTLYIFMILGAINFVSNNLNAQNINANYQSFDGRNILLFGCDYQQSTTRMYINVLNVTGGTGNYTLSTTGGGGFSSNTISAGQGFTFYFTEADQIAGNIGFTITDAVNTGTTYNLDPLIKTQIELLQFSVCNTPNYTCRNNIEHDGIMIPVSVFNTSDYIKSSGTILSPSTATTYLSGNSVELESGFEVPMNAEFLADIENCP